MANVQNRVLAPVNIFTHPFLSLTDRVLLVYNHFRNKEGYCTLNTYKVCHLVGRTSGVSALGEPMPDHSDVLAVRQARATLAKKGHLKHERKSMGIGEPKRDAFFVVAYAAAPTSMAVLNELGGRQKPPVAFEDPHKDKAAKIKKEEVPAAAAVEEEPVDLSEFLDAEPVPSKTHDLLEGLL